MEADESFNSRQGLMPAQVNSSSSSSKQYERNDLHLSNNGGELPKKRRNRAIGITAIAIAAAVVLAIILGIVLGHRKSQKNAADSSKYQSSASTGSTGKSSKLWGVGGDTIKVNCVTKLPSIG